MCHAYIHLIHLGDRADDAKNSSGLYFRENKIYRYLVNIGIGSNISIYRVATARNIRQCQKWTIDMYVYVGCTQHYGLGWCGRESGYLRTDENDGRPLPFSSVCTETGIANHKTRTDVGGVRDKFPRGFCRMFSPSELLRHQIIKFSTNQRIK